MALSAILAFGAAGTAAASTNTDNASAAEFSETEPDRAVAFPGADGRVSLQPEGAAERYIMLQI